MSSRSRLYKPDLVLSPWVLPQGGPAYGNRITARQLADLGVLVGVAGGSAPLTGYHTEGDIVRFTNNNVDVRVLWREFQQALGLLNQQRQPLVDLLTYTVAEPVATIPQVGNNSAFEKASEFGVPVGMRTDVTYFQMGFSFDDYDTGVRYTWKFLRDADDEQVRSVNDAIMEADNRLMFGEVMRTFYRPTNRTVDILNQAYTVYSFYNNDGTVPPSYKTNTFLGTHNHYRVSGAATVDSGDLDELIDDLASHGYSRANGYEIVMMVSNTELNTIRTFKSVQNSGTARYDFIPALGTPNFLLPANFVVNQDQGSRPSATYRGIRVAGSYGDALILNDEFFPTGYVSAFATGGPENVGNPVGIREHARPEFRGLRLVKGRDPDYPLQEAYYQRSFGTGIRHRGAGIIMQIKASGSYVAPTMYT